MRAHWAIAVIVSILILGTLVTGLTPNAYAAQTLTIEKAELDLKKSKLHIKSTVSGFSPTDLDNFQVIYALRNNANEELAAGFCFLVNQGNDFHCYSLDGTNTLEVYKIDLKLDKGSIHIDAFVPGFSTYKPGELEVFIALLCGPNLERAMDTTPLMIKGFHT